MAGGGQPPVSSFSHYRPERRTTQFSPWIKIFKKSDKLFVRIYIEEIFYGIILTSTNVESREAARFFYKYGKFFGMIRIIPYFHSSSDLNFSTYPSRTAIRNANFPEESWRFTALVKKLRIRQGILYRNIKYVKSVHRRILLSFQLLLFGRHWPKPN